MTEDKKRFPDPIRMLESAGWPEVVDRVILRACHDLNGRISTLSHLALRVAEGEERPESIVQALEEESRRLSRLVALLEALPDTGIREAEAISLSELVSSLAHLTSRQAGLDGTRITVRTVTEPPPVLVDRTVLSRSLALLLTHVAAECRRWGGKRMEVVVSEEDEGALLTLRGYPTHGTVRESAPESVVGEVSFSRQEPLELVAEVLGRSGGRIENLEEMDAGWGLRMWLPSLAQARSGT